MFLKLNHQQLDVYSISRSLLIHIYKLIRKLPEEERYGLCSQLRRAAVSVHLNIAEGASRKSIAERRRFYEISRGSLVEIDTILDISFELGYFCREDIKDIELYMVRCFQLLSGLMISKN